MKKLLLLIVLGLVTINAQADCKVVVTNKTATNFMGFYELNDALADRGYYRETYINKKPDILIKFELIQPYICSQSRNSILDEIGRPLNRMRMIVSTKDGEKVYEKGMRFFYQRKNIERKTIKKLIKKLPKCAPTSK